MEKMPVVVWWRRLAAAFTALLFTLVLVTILYTARDFQRQPDLQWFNGGESQIVGMLLLGGGFILVVTDIFFVTPLVLLWPFSSQLRHSYLLMVASMFWPPLFDIVIFWHGGPLHELKEMRRFPLAQLCLELIALCASGTYLLLIHLQARRLPRHS